MIFGILTGYADNTTFFVKNQTSAIEVLKVFDNFSKISGLKLNKSKCEIAGICPLKVVRVSDTLQHAIHQLKRNKC